MEPVLVADGKLPNRDKCEQDGGDEKQKRIDKGWDITLRVHIERRIQKIEHEFLPITVDIPDAKKTQVLSPDARPDQRGDQSDQEEKDV
jgi:hypothetical protein